MCRAAGPRGSSKTGFDSRIGRLLTYLLSPEVRDGEIGPDRRVRADSGGHDSRVQGGGVVLVFPRVYGARREDE